MANCYEDRVPDAIYESDNGWGIPTLDDTMQARCIEAPIKKWGEQGHVYYTNAGLIHFYVDDIRFESIWRHPEIIADTHPHNVCEINYSMFNDMPLSFVLWRIFKKRWLARYWQARGISIFVDVFSCEKWWEYNLLGVPLTWRAFCMRGHADQENLIDDAYGRLIARSSGDKLLFLVFGGGKKIEEFCIRKNIVYHDTQRIHKPVDTNLLLPGV